MKNITIIVSLFMSIVTFGQQKSTPVLDEENGLVKATYLFDNGAVQQQGFFKDGKLHGVWVSFDENGVKKSTAQYSNGEKTGKWFFWNESSLSEVDYDQNKIAAVKKWNKESIADKN